MRCIYIYIYIQNNHEYKYLDKQINCSYWKHVTMSDTTVFGTVWDSALDCLGLCFGLFGTLLWTVWDSALDCLGLCCQHIWVSALC